MGAAGLILLVIAWNQVIGWNFPNRKIKYWKKVLISWIMISSGMAEIYWLNTRGHSCKHVNVRSICHEQSQTAFLKKSCTSKSIKMGQPVNTLRNHFKNWFFKVIRCSLFCFCTSTPFFNFIFFNIHFLLFYPTQMPSYFCGYSFIVYRYYLFSVNIKHFFFILII